MSTTTPTGLHEYECQPGTPLHSVLVGAVANKATAVHIWEQASTTHMMMLPGMEDRPVDSSPAEMVAGLLARPPVGMTNFDEIVLHALGMRTHGNQDLSTQALIGSLLTRWRLTYRPAVAGLLIRPSTGRATRA